MSIIATPSGSGAPVPALTLAQASNPNDTTQGTVSGQLLAEVIASEAPGDISTAKTLTVTTVGQTVFTLPTTPTNPTSAVLFINSAEYATPAAFTISGNTLTWNGGFHLSTTDDVRVAYI